MCYSNITITVTLERLTLHLIVLEVFGYFWEATLPNRYFPLVDKLYNGVPVSKIHGTYLWFFWNVISIISFETWVLSCFWYLVYLFRKFILIFHGSGFNKHVSDSDFINCSSSPTAAVWTSFNTVFLSQVWSCIRLFLWLWLILWL